MPTQVELFRQRGAQRVDGHEGESCLQDLSMTFGDISRGFNIHCREDLRARHTCSIIVNTM